MRLIMGYDYEYPIFFDIGRILEDASITYAGQSHRDANRPAGVDDLTESIIDECNGLLVFYAADSFIPVDP